MAINKVHEVKCLHEYFVAVIEGRMTFEVWKFDRDYKEGDGLLLVETWKSGKMTGRAAYCYISYVLPGGAWGIDRDYCVLGIRMWHLNRLEITHAESD